MHIAQVAPVVESVPPGLYGGTERIVSYLTEALIARGHSVTLFASGDSQTAAELVAICPKALRLAAEMHYLEAYQAAQLAEVRRRANQFDVLHFHTSFLHLPIAKTLGTPALTTIHSGLEEGPVRVTYQHFKTCPFVSLSVAHQQCLPDLNWVGVVGNGIPHDQYRYGAGKGGYVAFLGRFTDQKRPDRAIKIALAAGVPIKIAAKLDEKDESYFKEHISPFLSNPLVDYLGELDEAEKQTLLAGAKALLFPIEWSEPFGLAVTESLACGTPVIAYRRGSMPELIEDGVTGYIVDSVEEGVAALQKIDYLSRQACRDSFDRNFTAQIMAEGYIQVYEKLMIS